MVLRNAVLCSERGEGGGGGEARSEMHCSAVQCSAVQCSGVQYSREVKCDLVMEIYGSCYNNNNPCYNPRVLSLSLSLSLFLSFSHLAAYPLLASLLLLLVVC